MEESQQRRIDVLLSHVAQRPNAHAPLEAHHTAGFQGGLLKGKVRGSLLWCCCIPLLQRS